MFLPIILLSISLNSENFEQLESHYWDCDTKYQRGEMEEGPEWNECLEIGREFESNFKDRRSLLQYWFNNRKEKWGQRGFKPDIVQ